MISWAENRLGSSKYDNLSLLFVEDAMENSNQIKVFANESIKELYDLYKDKLHQGKPERGTIVFYDCRTLNEDGSVSWGHCGIGLRDGKVSTSLTQ